MLKRRVVIKRVSRDFAGKEGIVVAVRNMNHDSSGDVACKVLVGDKVSNWIPLSLLVFVDSYCTSA